MIDSVIDHEVKVELGVVFMVCKRKSSQIMGNHRGRVVYPNAPNRSTPYETLFPNYIQINPLGVFVAHCICEHELDSERISYCL